MGEPITWRNVTGPSPAEAARPLEFARQSFNDAFAGLKQGLTDYQTAQRAATVRNSAEQRLTYQELLNGATTADQVAVLQPQLQGLLTGMEPTDREKLVGAPANYIATLQSRAKATQEAADLQASVAARPVVNKAMKQAFNRDATGALNTLGTVADTLPDGGAHLASVFQAFRNSQEEDRKNRLFPTQQEIQYRTAEKLYLEGEQMLADMQRGKPVPVEQQLRLAKGWEDISTRLNGVDDTVAKPKVQDAIFKEVKTRFPDPKEAARVTEQLRLVMSDPKNAGIRSADMLQLLSNTDIKTFFGLGGKNLASEAEAFRNSDAYTKSSLGLEQKKLQAQQEADQYLTMWRSTMGGAVPGRTPKPYVPMFSQPGTTPPQTATPQAGEVSGNGYDTVYAYGKYGQPPKPITQMSIGEASDFGRTLIENTRGTLKDQPANVGTSAMGKYQFTQETLNDYGRRVFSDDYKRVSLTPANQEKLAEALFHDRKGGNLKATWEGLPDSRPGAYKDKTWAEMREIISKAEGTQGTQDTSGARGAFVASMPSLASPGNTTAPAVSVAESAQSKKEAPASPKEATKNKLDALFLERVALEQEMKDAGMIKEYSPEVAKHLKDTQQSEAAAIRAGIKSGIDTTRSAGDTALDWLGTLAARGAASALDLGTSPVRAVAGFYNGAANIANAYGADLPTFEKGSPMTNMTGFNDQLSKISRTSPENQERLRLRSKALEARLAQAETEAKKAK